MHHNMYISRAVPARISFRQIFRSHVTVVLTSLQTVNVCLYLAGAETRQYFLWYYIANVMHNRTHWMSILSQPNKGLSLRMHQTMYAILAIAYMYSSTDITSIAARGPIRTHLA
ncbi:hypothetical protein DFH27DRAFT_563111 [Peziza echinospora]|nr:hypothetical protein DFH27DRAFT_563111 [Peziza echinospora]